MSLLVRNCNPCQATLYHAHCHLHFKVINIFQDKIKHSKNKFLNGQIIIFSARQKGNKVSHFVRLKTRNIFCGLLDIANLDLDFRLVRILDLDPSLNNFSPRNACSSVR